MPKRAVAARRERNKAILTEKLPEIFTLDWMKKKKKLRKKGRMTKPAVLKTKAMQNGEIWIQELLPGRSYIHNS